MKSAKWLKALSREFQLDGSEFTGKSSFFCVFCRQFALEVGGEDIFGFGSGSSFNLRDF
jgi:hypothetical protein